MSEHFFGVSTARLSREDADRLEAIAKRYGGGLVEATVPGTGYQRWIAVPNYGDIENRATEEKLLAEARAAGIDV